MRFEITLNVPGTRTGQALAGLLRRCLGGRGQVVQVQGPLPAMRLVAEYTVEEALKPKERPRFARGGRPYTPRTTLASEAQIRHGFRQAHPGPPDARSLFEVRITTAHASRHRRDVDNLSKTVLDGLNGVAWADDAQVLALSIRKGWDPEQAWTKVQIFAINEE